VSAASRYRQAIEAAERDPSPAAAQAIERARRALTARRLECQQTFASPREEDDYIQGLYLDACEAEGDAAARAWAKVRRAAARAIEASPKTSRTPGWDRRRLDYLLWVHEESKR
jgi:hypothetical protein